MRFKLGIILVILMGMLAYSSHAFAEGSRAEYAQNAKYHMSKAKSMKDIGSGVGNDHYLMLAIYHATMAANNLKLVDLLSRQDILRDRETRRALTEE